MIADDRTVLAPAEPHPSSKYAIDFINSLSRSYLYRLAETLASCSLSGNRTSEVCYGTLERLMNNEPVSDRYIMGLVLLILKMEDVLEPVELKVQLKGVIDKCL